MTDWNAYRQCPQCFAAIGQACVSVSSMRNGELRPGGVPSERPHSRRKLRKGYGR